MGRVFATVISFDAISAPRCWSSISHDRVLRPHSAVVTSRTCITCSRAVRTPSSWFTEVNSASVETSNAVSANVCASWETSAAIPAAISSSGLPMSSG